MPTTILMVRHATHPLVGRVLCGRIPGVHLDAAGHREAARLGARLAREEPAALYTSPLERARETAAAIGNACGLVPALHEGLQEIDFGTWSGTGFDHLADDPEWQRWNEARSSACPPGGESMEQAQARAVAGLQRIHAAHPNAKLIAVSHGDVIKAALMWCLGLPLDAYQRFDIDPASVSALVVWEGGGKVTRMNEGITA